MSNKMQRYLLLRQVLLLIATRIKATIPASHTSLNKIATADKKLLNIYVGLITYAFILGVFSARCSLHVSPSCYS
jgi:hypothetical protein